LTFGKHDKQNYVSINIKAKIVMVTVLYYY